MESTGTPTPAPLQPLGYETVHPDALLGTDRLLADLGGHSARGGALMIASDTFQLVLGFVSTFVLARILVPGDFGLVAMVGSIMAFVATMRDFGLPMATVQKPNLTHIQLSNLFWLNLKLAALVAILLTGLAPAIAWFYRQPQLTAITWVMTVGVFAVGMSTIHMGLLRRQMRFRAITAIESCGAAAGVAVAIPAAMMGAGYWALVLQQVTASVATGAALWAVSRWRPGPPQRNGDDPEMRSMLSYGKYLTGSRAVNYVGKNLDVVLIGKFAGAAPAGLYQKAEQWAGLTFWQVYSPLSDVLVASFSRLQQDPERYRAYFRKSVMGLYFITAPAMAFACVGANEIILLLLGPKWAAAVPIFRVMAIGALAGSVLHVAKWIYLAEGSTKRQLSWSLIATPVLVGGVIAGLHWGAIGVACGYTVASCMLALPGLRYALKGSPLHVSDFASAVWRPTLAALLAAVALFGLQRGAPEIQPLIVRFIRDFCFISVVYLVLWVLMPGGWRSLRELLNLLRHLRA
ncbi:MAG TPA: lipopolysaccharide biosynthesis protein [Tepidisphaeraceae bacterium]|jgi:O-antigen/teichoic acid export membrane protein